MTDHFPFLNNRKIKKGGTGTAMARRIADHLDRIPHDTYVEPFLGRGDVFRAKSKASVEILNDLDCKRVKQAKRVSCKMSRPEQCRRITKESQITCGQNWTKLLKHDSKSTLFFMDPPWAETVDRRQMPYMHDNPIMPS